MARSVLAESYTWHGVSRNPFVSALLVLLLL
ncbi:hypothetical protein MARINON1_50065 [Marinobacter salarius]|jgi:hypothetical protein|nr:hypothetical protein MBHK15_120065 [Marinobacter salarius]VXB30313.1 hypothetical protein MARINON1_50065 [Marinobacter salarius]